MAEWGKGDDRWLVENRQDGQNVNQWHWSEKDCLPWSRARFGELFEDAVLTQGSAGVTARVTAVDSVEGEAFLNVRKKKLIPSYELAVKLSFSAEVEQSGAKERVTGKVVLPYVAEENHDEDPEVQVKPDSESAAARTAKDAIFSSRKEAIFSKVGTFVEEFHAGTPAGHAADAPSARPVVKDHHSGSAAAATAADKSAAGGKAAAARSGGAGSSGQTIVMKETFYAGRGDLYAALTDEGRIRAYTQSEANVSSEVGGAFSMFGGSIIGTQRELEPGRRIVQDWRFNTWPDGVHSKVVIEIEEPEPGHTHVTLTQTGVPEEDKFGNHDVIGTTEKGWRDLIFYRIRAVFGYGL